MLKSDSSLAEQTEMPIQTEQLDEYIGRDLAKDVAAHESETAKKCIEPLPQAQPVHSGRLDEAAMEQIRGRVILLPIVIKVALPMAIKFGPQALSAIQASTKPGQRIVQIAHHGAHHFFPRLGKKLPHIQCNIWRHGIKNSHRPLFRLPTRFSR